MKLKFHTLEHIGVCCLLRRGLGLAKIALAQHFSFIFFKMNEAGFIHLGKSRGIPLKAALVAVLSVFLVPFESSRAEDPREAWHTELNGQTERSVSYSTYVTLLATKSTAKISFYRNIERTETSIGTLGLRVEIANYASLGDFHFSDFEGPDAPALGRPLMKVSIQQAADQLLSFELAPVGFVSSDVRSDQLLFSFLVAQPSTEPSTAKEILRALGKDARSLELTISDTHNASITMRLVVPVAERSEDFRKLGEDLR